MFSINHTEMVLDLPTVAERLLSVTGDAVTLCPAHGAPLSPPTRTPLDTNPAPNVPGSSPSPRPKDSPVEGSG